MSIVLGLTILVGLLTIKNLFILVLNLKLYTEIMKEKNQRNRQ